MKIFPLRVCSIAVFLFVCHPISGALAADVQPQSTPRAFLTARFASPEQCASPLALVGPAFLPAQGPALATRPPAVELVRISAGRQEKIGSQYHLRGNVEVAYRDMHLVADEADYEAYLPFARAGAARAARARRDERGRFLPNSGLKKGRIF